MGTEIYLRIRAAARNDYIYRIISVQRLFDLFENKNNVLVAPAKWDDPFENFILRSQRVYGQCWTLQRASDAMWRIYSPNADAVRVRSTAGTVAQSLRFALNDKLQGDVFIGRVRYLPNEQLMSFAKRVRELSNQRPSKITAETLLVKRPAFRHEREVRLVFVPKTTNSAANETVAYPVDPHELIDQIMMDPRMCVHECEKLKGRIRTRLKFGGAIKRSLLYAPPPDLRIEL